MGPMGNCDELCCAELCDVFLVTFSSLNLVMEVVINFVFFLFVIFSHQIQ